MFRVREIESKVIVGCVPVASWRALEAPPGISSLQWSWILALLGCVHHLHLCRPAFSLCVCHSLLLSKDSCPIRLRTCPNSVWPPSLNTLIPNWVTFSRVRARLCISGDTALPALNNTHDFPSVPHLSQTLYHPCQREAIIQLGTYGKLILEGPTKSGLRSKQGQSARPSGTADFTSPFYYHRHHGCYC